jgi:hypothetical protein
MPGEQRLMRSKNVFDIDAETGRAIKSFTYAQQAQH